MGAEEYNMKERIWMSRMEYAVLKEKMKENECGWYNVLQMQNCVVYPAMT
jgi:hypothetical protein